MSIVLVGCYAVFALASAWSSTGAPTRQGTIVDDVCIMAFAAVPVGAAIGASRRCRAVPRLAAAWRWIAVWLGALFAGFAAVAVGALTPSTPLFRGGWIVDVAFLSSYPVMLFALLRLPYHAQSRAGMLRMATDASLVLLASASVIWFVVLGPVLAVRDPRLIQRVISVAYPAGNILELFAIIWIVARVRVAQLRRPLRLLTVGVVLDIVGSSLFSRLDGQPAAAGLALANVAWVGGIVLFGLAAASQQTVAADAGLGDDQRDVAVSFVWLPNAAPLVLLVLVGASQFGGSSVRRVGFTAATFVAVVLVGLRQYLAQRDTVAARQEAERQAHTAAALLELSSNLGTTSGGSQIAANVARTVMTIADCTQAAVFLFSDDRPLTPGENEVTSGDGSVHGLAASYGYLDEDDAVVQFRTLWSSAETPATFRRGRVEAAQLTGVDKTTVAVPMISRDRTIGWIVATLDATSRHLVDTEVTYRMQTLASQGATAITNVSLVDKVRHQARHDSLTDLPNRAYIFERADRMLDAAGVLQTAVAALFVDLDGFKDINDTFGHDAGDHVLGVTAGRLRTVIRTGDVVGRLGGDEFVVLLSSDPLDARPELVAARILQTLSELVELPANHSVQLTASIGLAIGRYDSAQELLLDADIALYQAKVAGKDRYVVFDPGMRVVVQQQRALLTDLRSALELDQFHLLYQPIVDLNDGRISGVEALLRWTHPSRGLVLPDQFIPSLEQSGLIVEVGKWVLRQACEQGQRWHQQGYPLNIAVNVAVAQIENERFVKDVLGALDATGLEPSALIIEITETGMMSNFALIMGRLAVLRSFGIRIAIDDFGTGYSSLSYLRELPVDILKVDRSFIADIHEQAAASAMVDTFLQLGTDLGLETWAEGIEVSGQLARLQNAHYQTGQGYFFARPLAVADLETLLTRNVTAGLGTGRSGHQQDHDPDDDLDGGRPGGAGLNLSSRIASG
jgi:diguanylate cyclase (GGDEF)-like protein